MRWPGAGTRPPEQSHDDARQDQSSSPSAHGGNSEPCATARRDAIKNYQEAKAGATSPASARWFAIDYTEMDRASGWLRTLLGRGSGRGSVEVDSDMLRLRTDDFHLDIPRDSVRSVSRPEHQHRGTTGIHARRGSWLVTRSHDGLVELAIEPPCYLSPQLSTVSRAMKISSLIISLDDPDGFIVAVTGGARPGLR